MAEGAAVPGADECAAPGEPAGVEPHPARPAKLAAAASVPAAPASAAPSTSSPAPGVQPGGPAQACSQAGTYLTAVRTGEHSGYDQVAFQFSGKLPGYTVQQAQTVYSDPKGTPVPLAGQAYLRVVFRGTSAVCPQPPHQTYIGPAVLNPYDPQLLTVSAAGDFEGVLSFGIGLAAQGGYHAFTLTSPDRLVRPPGQRPRPVGHHQDHVGGLAAGGAAVGSRRATSAGFCRAAQPLRRPGIHMLHVGEKFPVSTREGSTPARARPA